MTDSDFCRQWLLNAPLIPAKDNEDDDFYWTVNNWWFILEEGRWRRWSHVGAYHQDIADSSNLVKVQGLMACICGRNFLYSTSHWTRKESVVLNQLRRATPDRQTSVFICEFPDEDFPDDETAQHVRELFTSLTREEL